MYTSLSEFLSASVSHRRTVPARFFIRDSRYFGPGVRNEAPADVASYYDMICLAEIVRNVADYPSAADRFANFVVRPDAKFRVEMDFSATDLVPIMGIEEFSSGFLLSDFHVDEKRAIVRDCLADLAKGMTTVPLVVVARGFDAVMKNAQASYALLLSKFSAASVQKEVDKQNLEDTLRLNKTFSEIQNQLLALPAALLVAGAAFETGKVYKNAAIFLGVAIFVVLMFLLIRNQKNSVSAISAEIALRRANLEGQPDAVAAMYIPAFSALERRVNTQQRTLNVVLALSALVFFFAAYASLDSALEGGLSDAGLALVKLAFCWH
ncbi:hypothetical protein C1929_07865 [Stenotrophomonas sp. ZAC14D1_NAIMI4_6]|nr:hypothetical protein C1929_07865 [Stenotrophomonas sp. ZAC14D1_NAIMI4_6]AWH40864.1 hypothetical protein C1927_08190 [Stenotrophomonas sp. ZAC14D1_NAIMI4_1]